MRGIIAVLPLLAGFILDCLLGDPYRLPHPVRLIGALISGLETRIRKTFAGHLTAGGAVLAAVTVLLSTGVPLAFLVLCYRGSVWIGVAAESIFCYYLLAARCLQKESMKVYTAVRAGDVEGARRAVSMIVGRDTAVLDEAGIIRAAVETVAENTSDGVTAHLFYLMLGGAPLGFLYKAVNTMDSMVGYKEETYREIGRTAARTDDVLNWLPSRLTALLMIAAAFLLGFDGANAYRIWRRDRRKHASPNSAQTESVCAGALGIRLAGDAWYFGKLHKKPFLGDPLREVEAEDIRRANRLMYAASVMMLCLALAVRAGVFWMFG